MDQQPLGISMTKNVRIFLSALIFIFTTNAGAAPRSVPSPAALELEHTKLIYDGYVGQSEEQKANMLELTIARLERTKKMHKDSGVQDRALLEDMLNFGESLFATRHMMRASTASKSGNEDVVRKELTTACRHAEQTTYLDPRLQETCNRFRKYGYVRIT